LSAKLGKKIKVTPTVLLPVDTKLYVDWSANLFTAARSQYILISNTVSLYSIVIFGAGITDKNKLLTRMINSMEELMRQDGDEFIFDLLIAPFASTLLFSKALNRAVIGSMNDLVFQSKVFLIEGCMSPFDVSKKLNETPMSYLKYSNPRDEFKKMMNNIVPFNLYTRCLH
jgi:hypothetical protein